MIFTPAQDPENHAVKITSQILPQKSADVAMAFSATAKACWALDGAATDGQSNKITDRRPNGLTDGWRRLPVGRRPTAAVLDQV